MSKLTDLTERQKRNLRVKVAKDVLEQLKWGFYKAERGVYAELVMKTNEYGNDLSLETSKDLQKQLCNIDSCEVCGIGSVFMSLVRLKDSYRPTPCETMGSLEDGRMRRLLGKVFSKEQISMIETAFEGRHVDDFELTDEQYERSVYFAEYQHPAAQTLRRIMQNIIRNKGTFNPPEI